MSAIAVDEYLERTFQQMSANKNGDIIIIMNDISKSKSCGECGEKILFVPQPNYKRIAEKVLHIPPPNLSIRKDSDDITPSKKKGCGCKSTIKKIIRGEHPLQCLDCVSGHISSAMVMCEEILKGYDGVIFADKPNHIPLLRGHIEQAEAQCARMFPELSSSIRNVKLQMSKLKEFNYKEALSSLNELFWKAEALKESEETLKV